MSAVASHRGVRVVTEPASAGRRPAAVAVARNCMNCLMSNELCCVSSLRDLLGEGGVGALVGLYPGRWGVLSGRRVVGHAKPSERTNSGSKRIVFHGARPYVGTAYWRRSVGDWISSRAVRGPGLRYIINLQDESGDKDTTGPWDASWGAHEGGRVTHRGLRLAGRSRAGPRVPLRATDQPRQGAARLSWLTPCEPSSRPSSEKQGRDTGAT